MTKSKLKVFKFIIPLVMLLVVIIGVLIRGEILENSTPPIVFPFDDTAATYVITKDPADNLYRIVYDTTKDREKLDTCDEPVGGLARCWVEGDFHSEVPIAQSPVDLADFIDKKVKIDGVFVYSTKQCISDKCKDMGSEKAGLSISTIMLDN